MSSTCYRTDLSNLSALYVNTDFCTRPLSANLRPGKSVIGDFSPLLGKTEESEVTRKGTQTVRVLLVLKNPDRRSLVIPSGRDLDSAYRPEIEL